MTDQVPQFDMPLEDLFSVLARMAAHEGDLPDESTDEGRTTREFLASNWANAADGLLARTKKIRAWPHNSAVPCVFRFEIDVPYKRKVGADGPVELAEGPLRGTIVYRPDLFSAPAEEPLIVVMVDRDQGFFHPNHSRQYGMICLGDLQQIPGTPELETVLEHVYGIVTYQNRRPFHPADFEAARYFAYDAEAMTGLEQVDPLY